MAPGVDVGIIDGGVDFAPELIRQDRPAENRHPDQADLLTMRGDRYALHSSWNFESDCPEQFDPHFYEGLSEANRANYEYYLGHGTAVAGIIAVCTPQARLHALKMPFDFLVEEDEVCRTPLPLAVLREKARHKTEARRLLFNNMKRFILIHRIPVVNCSWNEAFSDKINEIAACYPFLKGDQLIDVARLHFDGIITVLREFFESIEFRDRTLFIIAAGNQHADLNENPIYPGVVKQPNTLTVGGTDATKGWWKDREDFGSNFAARYLDLCTRATHYRVPWGKNSFKTKSGTSLATPVITALALRILGEAPTLRPEELRREILDRCIEVPSLSDKVCDGRWFDIEHLQPRISAIMSD